MNWGLYFGFFGLSMIKFLFAPFGGPHAGLSFLETYLSCVAGAVFCAIIFYFSAEFFMIRAHKKRKALIAAAKASGQELKKKKKFTKTNKLIVNIKRRFGIVGVSMFAPLFLSVPIGSIISAKFYGKDKRTFLLILFGIVVNGAITTSLAFGAFHLF
ncbi:MAG: hypothetical protein IT221_05910 [Fluviicola sp.]|nr:hypothetical protein [Fluviicola sp.]